jgi:transposase-like protein
MFMRRQRRRFNGEEKVRILKRHLVDQVPVSDLCDEIGLQPTVFYRWQKQFFENGAAAFERSGKRGKSKLEEKVSKLEVKLSHKDEVIAEIMEDYVKLKKELGEP